MPVRRTLNVHARQELPLNLSLWNGSFVPGARVRLSTGNGRPWFQISVFSARASPLVAANSDEEPITYVLRIAGVMLMIFGIAIGGMVTLFNLAQL